MTDLLLISFPTVGMRGSVSYWWVIVIPPLDDDKQVDNP